MEIPLVYILISAEIMVISLGLCITFGILLFRKSRSVTKESEIDNTVTGRANVDIGISYIEYLDKAIEKNATKIRQHEIVEADEENVLDISDSETGDDSNGAVSDDSQSKLLQARQEFLLLEKSAAENAEHEINFWDGLYNGLKGVLDNIKISHTLSDSTKELIGSVQNTNTPGGSVTIIETHRGKINGEVDKLKNIAHEQANVLSSMKQTIKDTEAESPEDRPALSALNKQIAAMERQLKESKMCTDILEAENERLLEDIEKLESSAGTLSAENKSGATAEPEPMVDLDQMKEVVAKQKEKINQLIENIDALDIAPEKTEALKNPLKDITRNSNDMMGCIIILEDENQRLQQSSY